MNELSSTLHEFDDRGLVLSLAAFTEHLLGLLLAEFLNPSAATVQLFEGFNAPLTGH